ncbi:MAG: hypothetical protein WCL17_05970 [Actinomycetota bacterium]
MCHTRRTDSDLLRVGRDAQGAWQVGRGSGRGVWLCGVGECLKQLGVHHLAFALKGEVHGSELEVVQELLVSFNR